MSKNAGANQNPLVTLCHPACPNPQASPANVLNTGCKLIPPFPSAVQTCSCAEEFECAVAIERKFDASLEFAQGKDDMSNEMASLNGLAVQLFVDLGPVAANEELEPNVSMSSTKVWALCVVQVEETLALKASAAEKASEMRAGCQESTPMLRMNPSRPLVAAK